MSVMVPISPSRRWLPFWPLALFVLLAGLGCLALWHYWPQVMLNSIRWQRTVNIEMSQLLKGVADNPLRVGVSLLAFSFTYGVLHALGPGHGKVVIATWLATHPSKLKTSLRLTFAASLLQGVVAIALVSVVLALLKLPARSLHLSSFWLEKGSYLLVGVLGLLLCYRAIKALRRLAPRPRRFTAFTPHHHHHAGCGCGHQHLPDSEQLARATSWKTSLLVVLSMGLRPCSGAIMMLLFSRVIGVYGWGVVSALAMAVGTALTVSAMALLVQSSRTLAIRLNRRATPARWQRVALQSLALAGGALLIAGGVMLWLSAQPALSGGLRPLG